MYQLSKFSLGKARSLAPIAIGRTKLPRVLGMGAERPRRRIHLLLPAVYHRTPAWSARSVAATFRSALPGERNRVVVNRYSSMTRRTACEALNVILANQTRAEQSLIAGRRVVHIKAEEPRRRPATQHQERTKKRIRNQPDADRGKCDQDARPDHDDGGQILPQRAQVGQKPGNRRLAEARPADDRCEVNVFVRQRIQRLFHISALARDLSAA